MTRRRSPAAIRATRDRALLKAYIADLAPAPRRALTRLRAIIRGAAPGLKPAFSYGIPALQLDGRPVIWFAAWKAHTSIYPVPARFRRRRARTLKGYAVSKGTLRFPLEQPLPIGLIQELVRARLAEVRLAREPKDS